MTIWKPIPFLPERFQASDDARVKTLEYERTFINRRGNPETRHYKERILLQRLGKPTWRGVKHPVVGIYLGDSRTTARKVETRVAYCAAAAFYGVPWKDSVERHKWRIRFRDGNYLNCRAENLEWMHSFGEDGEVIVGQTTYERNLNALESRSRTNTAWDDTVKYYGLDDAIAMYREDGMELPIGVAA